VVDNVKPSIKRAKDEAKCLRVAIALVSGSRQSGMHGAWTHAGTRVTAWGKGCYFSHIHDLLDEMPRLGVV